MSGDVRVGGQGMRIAAWSLVLVLAILIFAPRMNPLVPNTMAVVEPAPSAAASGDVYLAGQDQLLPTTYRHKLYRQNLTAGDSTRLLEIKPRLLDWIDDHFVVVMLIALIIVGTITSWIVLRLLQRMGPVAERIGECFDRRLEALEGEDEATVRHGELVWLKPGKQARRSKFWVRQAWKLAPIWSGALVLFGVMMALRVYERSDLVWAPLVIGIVMTILAIQCLILVRNEYNNSKHELGVDGMDLLLRDPDGKVQRFASRELLFDGDRVLLGQVTKTVYSQQRTLGRPTFENRIYLFEPAASELSLQRVLEQVPLVSHRKMNREVSRRGDTLLIDRAGVVASIALLVFSFLEFW
ncbi:hypothetical protein IC757_00955 [Wenzhouxiangella sp. AB-CW3]|uniref:hypothetical protein n=1 Tax=Wenzhouxiangella sp. AB-CW3 TaxID=2771012 RepID=UPI00168AA220|nr:hypothetical protein [Wenzhouxiangella sp. AB-CW3]QOC22766.1 hypothetical protein IC757_00955 [Wenzhouxiangella sp. AB-CW3]